MTYTCGRWHAIIGLDPQYDHMEGCSAYDDYIQGYNSYEDRQVNDVTDME